MYSDFFNFTYFSKLSKMEYVCLSTEYALCQIGMKCS